MGLTQLLGELERIQGTFPPVYRSGGMLIGYDKQGRIKVLATSQEGVARTKWLHKALKMFNRSVPRLTRH